MPGTQLITGLAARHQARSKQARYPDIRFKATFLNLEGLTVSTVDTTLGRQTNDLVRVTTYKHKSNPVGTYTLILVPRIDYFNLVTPGDWCLIESDNGDGRNFRPLMYGPVGEVRRTRTVTEKGATVTTITVQGADFGKPFAEVSALYDAKLSTDSTISNLGIGILAQALERTTGSPANILATIIDHYLLAYDDTQLIDPQTGLTFGVNNLDFRYLATDLIGSATIEPLNLGASLWEVMQQWANLSINELFIDYRPPYDNQTDLINLVPAVVLRQSPFWGSAWSNLTNIRMERSEVTDEDLGKSDADVKNWIRAFDEPTLTGLQDGMSMYINGLGSINPASVKKFGFRRFENPSQYMFDTDAANQGRQPQPILNLIEQFTGLQTLWHHSNEKLISGSITSYHNPDLRIGYKLNYVDPEAQTELQFYIEGVQHNLMYPGRSTTSLTLTRGRNPTDPLFNYDMNGLLANGVVKSLGTTLERISSTLNTLR